MAISCVNNIVYISESVVMNQHTFQIYMTAIETH